MIRQSLLPCFTYCKNCFQTLWQENIYEKKTQFYCDLCQQIIKWNHNTLLKRSQISFSQLEKLIHLYIDRNSVQSSFEFLCSTYVNDGLTKKTIRHYFLLFHKITQIYYHQSLESYLLEGELELDESQLFKKKKSSASHRPYSLSKIWVFGIIKRGTNQFVIIPISCKTEATLHKLILKYAKLGSTLYSDCCSCYVNNMSFPKKSKLTEYGYIHFFINHKLAFRSSTFEHIHTNSIESLWKKLKQNIRRMKMLSEYEFAVSRFFFHENLTKEQQILFLAKELKKENIS